MTTVHVPKEQIGAEIAKFLFDKIANPSNVGGMKVLPTTLMIRGTCGPPKDVA
jgi:DNA-binding LacI/PurR family transcriptional regulator